MVSQSPPRAPPTLPQSLPGSPGAPPRLDLCQGRICIQLGRSRALKLRVHQRDLCSQNTAADAPGAVDAAKVVARSVARTSLPHAPGARMAVVYTNFLK